MPKAVFIAHQPVPATRNTPATDTHFWRAKVPDRAQPLMDSALDEISKIKENGPGLVDIDNFVMEQKRRPEIQLLEQWILFRDAAIFDFV
jgi:hypothetical protein